MAQPTKLRTKYQLHLSTILLLSMLIGILMYLNFREAVHSETYLILGLSAEVEVAEYGWPFCYCRGYSAMKYAVSEETFLPWGLAKNILTGLILMLCVERVAAQPYVSKIFVWRKQSVS